MEERRDTEKTDHKNKNKHINKQETKKKKTTRPKPRQKKRTKHNDEKKKRESRFALRLHRIAPHRTAPHLLALAAAYPALNVLALLLHRVRQQLDVLQQDNSTAARYM